jgi:hypothetical protein
MTDLEIAERDTRLPRAGFFASRWNGDVRFIRLFVTDTLVVGTLINVVATVAAVLLLGAEVPDWLAVTVHFLPLPYNLFLFLAVWRTSERRQVPFAWAAQIAAALWLIAVTVA